MQKSNSFMENSPDKVLQNRIVFRAFHNFRFFNKDLQKLKVCREPTAKRGVVSVVWVHIASHSATLLYEIHYEFHSLGHLYHHLLNYFMFHEAFERSLQRVHKLTRRTLQF